MLNQSEIVFVRLAIPLITGIICFSRVQGFTWLYVLLGLGATIILFLVLLNFRYSKNNGYVHKRVAYACFYIFPFILGGSLTVLNDQLAHDNHFSKVQSDYLKVQIIEEPKAQTNIISIRAKVLEAFQKGKPLIVSGQLLISIQKEPSINDKGADGGGLKGQTATTEKLKSSNPAFRYGDQLFVPANFSVIAEPKNPYEFNIRKWYKQQNFFHRLYVPEQQVIKYKSDQGNSIMQVALNLRKKQVEYFRKLLKNDEAHAVAATLILGYRADLSEELLSAYSKTGTIHALSVSGMHVGLIYLIINFLLSFLERWGCGRILKFIITLSLLWFYAVIAGLAPSVLRSAIMLSIYITGTTFKKHQNSYNLLCFAAFIMLLHNPLLIYDVGFQLSYLSVLGLIFLQPLIYNWFHFQNIIADKLWNFFALSTAAQLATFPLAIYYFHQFPLYFLISNLFILLPISLIMYLGIAILILRIGFFGSIFEWLINFNNLGLKWISEQPFASISGIWISEAEVLLLSISLLAGILGLTYYNKKLVYVFLTAMCLLQISFLHKQYETQQQQRVIFFSLRNNSAIAFIHQNKTWLLTDLPENAKALQSAVIPALEQSGVTQITHLNIHQSFKGDEIRVKEHQVQFFNFNLLLADSCFNSRLLENKVEVDILTLSMIKNLELEQLLKNCKTKQLIIDGSNTIYHANRFERIAENFNVPLYNLKNKKAYLVNLTR